MSDVVMVFPKSSYLEKAMNHYYLPLPLLNSVIYVDKEYSVKIIDQRTDRDWKKNLRKELDKCPLCVGISSLTGEQIIFALEISRFVKENSDVPVVWGGTHANILPRQTLENRYIDYVIQGEGELSFYELVKALDKKRNLAKVRGLWRKSAGKIKGNPPAPLVDLNSLPDVPYHLVDVEDYVLRFNGERMLVMETSRGCPKQCSFCFVQNSPCQRRWRALSPEKVVEKMGYLKESFNIKGVEFQDLTSFVDLERMRDCCRLMIKERLGLFWNTCGGINDVLRMDREYLRLLERSNLLRLGLGVESGSDRILKMIKKGITVRQVLETSRKLSNTDIEPVYSFMAGFPTETEREVNMTSRLVIRLLDENPRAKTTIIHHYRPLPGTELFDICLEHGLEAPNSLEGWGEYTMDWIDYPWLSDSMQKKIRALNFLSLFLDRKYEEIDNLPVKLFSRMYQPIARWRVRNSNFGLMAAPYLKEMYVRLKR